MSGAVPSYCGKIRDRFGRVTYQTPRVYPTRAQAADQCFARRIKAKWCETTRGAFAVDGRVVDTGADAESHHRNHYGCAP